MYYLLCVITFFFWGSIYVVSKYAFAAFTPLTVLLLRNVVAIIPLFFIAKKQGMKKLEKAHIKYFIIIGVLGYACGSGLVTMSNHLMSSTISSLINAASPIAIMAMAALILKERLTPNKIIGITFALSGVVIVIGTSGDVTILGMIYSIAGMVLWAFGSVTCRRISGHYKPAQITLLGIIFSLPAALAGSIVENCMNPDLEPVSWLSIGAILYIGLFCIGLANYLWNICLSNMNASTCSMFYPLQPLFSGILGVILLGEEITSSLIGGGVIITAGIIIGLLNFKKPNRE